MIFGETTGNVMNPASAQGRMPAFSPRDLSMRIPRTMDRVVPEYRQMPIEAWGSRWGNLRIHPNGNITTRAGGLGLDWEDVLSTGKTVIGDIIKSIPGAAGQAVEKVIIEKTTPIAQQIATAKTTRVLKKGNVALMLVGGGVLGGFVAGGSWRRRAVGAIVVGGVATLVGWKIGWLADV
jgi:hypothetical protein